MYFSVGVGTVVVTFIYVCRVL